jgi:hypothetical protein
MRRRFAIALIASVLLVACAPSPSAIASAVAETEAARPTWTPATVLQTQEVTRVATVQVTVEIPVTVTPTATPIYTPTVTPTASRTPIPTNTPVPTATEDPTRAEKTDGFYLVGTEISAGLWRSSAGFDSCYWEITGETGNIIDNHFGMSGGTMYVPRAAYQVQLQDCGPWEFIKP